MFSSLFLLALIYTAPGEAPITGADWAVVQNPVASIYDAVVLLDTTSFFDTAIERFRRVRILSENGKAAAEFQDDTGTAKELKGRVLQPDGSETRFSQEDLVETLSARSKRGRSSTRLLVPPGLTDDCIVELSWTIPAQRGLPLKAATFFDAIAESWYVATKTYTFNKIRSQANEYLVRQIWTRAADDHFAVEEGSGFKKVTYRDIAAVEPQPFGNDYRHDNGHYVYAYRYYSDLNPNADKFWGDLSEKVVRQILTGLKFAPGSDWDEWVRELKAKLPADQVAAMTLVQSQFRKRFALTSMLSPEQAGKVTRTTQEDDVPERILGAVWRRGYGEMYELSMIFFRLVQALDLPVYLVYPSSVDELPFNPITLDDNSFNLYLPLYAVYAKDQPVIFAPTWYEYRPGYYPWYYLEMPALQVDPRTWKSQFIRMPGNSPESNRIVTQYKTQLSADGKLEQTYKRQVTGAYLANATRRYFPIPAVERAIQLRERWSDEQTTVNAAAVEGADDLDGIITETVSLNSTVPVDGITRLAIDPFPNALKLLDTPSVWSDHRDQDLFVGFAGQTVDLNTLSLPSGWKLFGDNDWEHTNQVGSVKFKCVQEGNKLTVRRDVTLHHGNYARELEGQFKEFLAWMDEAMDQSIALDLNGGTP